MPNNDINSVGGTPVKPDMTTSSTSTSYVQGRRNTQRRGQQRVAVPQQTKFEGDHPDLKGYIFDCRGAQAAEIYNKTIKQIATYVGREYKHGGDIKRAVELGKLPTINVPGNLDVDATEVEREIWRKRIDGYVKRTSVLDDNIQSLYSLVWGQCTEAMKSKAESQPQYIATHEANDGIALLAIIRNISYSFESQKYLPLAIFEAKRRYFNMKQGRLETVESLLERFQSQKGVLTQVGAVIGPDLGVAQQIAGVGAELAELTADHCQEALDRQDAVAFLMSADRNRYEGLLQDLENEYLKDQDNYPRSLHQAYSLLVNWKAPTYIRGTPTGAHDGVVFTQGVQEVVPTVQTATTLVNTGPEKIVCRYCKESGHGVDDCPKLAAKLAREQPTTTGTQLLTAGSGEDGFDDQPGSAQDWLFSQSGGGIPSSWILLDNQSTVDVFVNRG